MSTARRGEATIEMTDHSKKIVDPTETTLSAIQEALKVRDDENQQAPVELRNRAMWLRRELEDLAARVGRVTDVAMQMEREAARTVESEHQPRRRDLGDLAARLERALSDEPTEPPPQSVLHSAELAESELPDFAGRLERDLIDAAIRVSESEPRGLTGPAREFDFRELASRLERDLVELAARSPETEIRAVAYRSRAIARKMVHAYASRAPQAERYLPPRPYEPESAPQVEGRRNLRVGELPDDVVAALRRSDMDARHAHLDSLMQD